MEAKLEIKNCDVFPFRFTLEEVECISHAIDNLYAKMRENEMDKFISDKKEFYDYLHCVDNLKELFDETLWKIGKETDE
jgi:hypothetical protein